MDYKLSKLLSDTNDNVSEEELMSAFLGDISLMKKSENFYLKGINSEQKNLKI